jgi:hypothetical protein
MKKTVYLIFIFFAFFSCKEKSKENNGKFEFVKKEGSLYYYKLRDKNNKETRIILDSNFQVYQIDNLSTPSLNKYKLVMNKSRIEYIQNDSKTISEQVFLNSEPFEFIHKFEENGFIYENGFLNPKKPLVTFQSYKTESTGNYFSESKVFDFSKMEESKNEFTSYAVNLFDEKMLDIEKNNELGFKLVSNFDCHTLITSEFSSTFEPKMKTDSINIDKKFNYNFMPKSINDTIRFIVYCYNKKDKMGHSIYYELPVKSR